MFDYRGLQDVLFIALYCGVAFLAVLAAVYLLFRRRNVFMRERGPECMTIESPRGPVRIDRPMHSSLRLRRWTAALMATMAASHVWWYAIGQWWLADDWLVRTILVIMLDHATLVPLVMGVLLRMLQDRRRPLWPWLVVMLPVVMLADAGMDGRSWYYGYELPHYYQLAVCAVFVVYYIFALRQYGRWLRDNYADLKHKEVWQSLTFVVVLFVIYAVYTSNMGEMAREYLSQVISIVIIGFLVWRVETLEEFKGEEEFSKKTINKTTMIKQAKLWMMAAILVCGTMTALTSCSNDDDAVEPEQQVYSGVPLIILDTDIGSSTDDLFALEMLYRYQEQNRSRLLGVVVDREGEDYAACADVMNTYYGHGDIPIGLIRDGIKNPKVWIDYKALPTHTGQDGNPMFRRTVADYSQLPDGWQLYRQLLAAQPDHSVSIVSIGFVTCLAQLLQSAPDEYSSLSGVELVQQKVKCIYLMGGVFGDAIEPIENNFAQGPGFAQTFFRLCPADVDVIMTPGEVGDGIDYLPELVIADIDWTDIHPIKQVYMNYDCAKTGQKMWDPLAVMSAVEGSALFSLSGRGTVTVSDKGESFFTPSATGNVRYQQPGSEA